MKIIVAGCGKIGSTIISSFVEEGHDVVAIDDVHSVIEEITNIYDVMGVCGNGADCNTLLEAGIDKTELFVAVTGSDELNMLACFIARKMGAKHTSARIRNPEYDQSLSFIRQQLDISVAVNPDYLAAQVLFNTLKLPTAAKVETFSRRNFEMVELCLKPDSILDGVKLVDMRKKYPAQYLVCLVQRGEEVFIPGGDFILHGGDRVGITATPAEIQKLFRLLGTMQKQARNVMILGASRTAYYLSKMLLAEGTNVKIIEKDPKVTDFICEQLPNAVVIQGDGAQQELLLEEGIRSTDAFVTLTGMDEENVLISYFATQQEVPKVITKVNRNEFAAIAADLGLDSIVSPRKIMSDILVRYARALHSSLGSKMETLYKLMDEKAEALEFKVKSDFEYCEIPLKDMDFKSNVIIAGIIRGRKIIIPAGNDVILPDDRVIVITSRQGMDDLSDIIK